MTDHSDIISSVQEECCKEDHLSPSCCPANVPARQDDHVTEVSSVVERGELVEDYPQDVRGHSCLLLDDGKGGTPNPCCLLTQR
jgi:hypothetical protein